MWFSNSFDVSNIRKRINLCKIRIIVSINYCFNTKVCCCMLDGRSSSCFRVYTGMIESNNVLWVATRTRSYWHKSSLMLQHIHQNRKSQAEILFVVSYIGFFNAFSVCESHLMRWKEGIRQSKHTYVAYLKITNNVHVFVRLIFWYRN